MGSRTAELTEACAWALERLDTNLTVKDLADHTHLRQSVFARRSSDEMGVPPSEWLGLVRLERAREPLGRDDLSLVDVALSSGFRSTANLRARFRQQTGTTPVEYRDAHRRGSHGG